MAILTDRSTGLERIARELLIILIDNVNTELQTLQTEWQTFDTELARKRLIPDKKIILEQVDLTNFVLGHRPSLIEGPIDNYPNVAVLAERSDPAPVEQPDQVHLLLDTITVEIMVKSLEGEEECNRRCWRLVDAVNNVVNKNRTLNGLVEEIYTPATIFISDVLKRREQRGAGLDYFWQGAALTYEFLKISDLAI